MLSIWLAACALRMLAALADAACSAAVANSPGFGRWPPSLTSKNVRDSPTSRRDLYVADGTNGSRLRHVSHPHSHPLRLLRKGRDSRPLGLGGVLVDGMSRDIVDTSRRRCRHGSVPLCGRCRGRGGPVGARGGPGAWGVEVVGGGARRPLPSRRLRGVGAPVETSESFATRVTDVLEDEIVRVRKQLVEETSCWSPHHRVASAAPRCRDPVGVDDLAGVAPTRFRGS